MVYVAAAMSGTKGGLYWAALVGIGIGFMGPPTFLFMDVGAVVVATWLAHQTLDLKGRPEREQSVDAWPRNPKNRDFPTQGATTRETSSGATPEFGPARWSTDDTNRSTSAVRPQAAPGQPVSRERFQFYFVQERPDLVAQQARITPENSIAYHLEVVKLRAQLQQEFPEADFGLSAVAGRSIEMHDWNHLDVVHANLSNIRDKALAERKRKELATSLNARQSRTKRRS